MPAPNPPDPLDPLLDSWARRTPSVPGPVAPAVWQRIRETGPQTVDYGWLARLHAAFARPAFATAFVVACVLLGLFLAEARSSRLQVEYSARLARSYLRLIDPLLSETSTRPETKP